MFVQTESACNNRAVTSLMGNNTTTSSTYIIMRMLPLVYRPGLTRNILNQCFRRPLRRYSCQVHPASFRPNKFLQSLSIDMPGDEPRIMEQQGMCMKCQFLC